MEHSAAEGYDDLLTKTLSNQQKTLKDIMQQKLTCTQTRYLTCHSANHARAENSSRRELLVVNLLKIYEERAG